MGTSCILFDIDGTLADIDHRLHFIKQKPKDYKSFHAGIPNDKLIEPVAELYRILKVSDCIEVVCYTGRQEMSRWATLDWMARKGLPRPKAMYMRADGDNRIDDIVKAELAAKAIEDGWEPLLVIDDRKGVVEKMRSLGYCVLQCAEGDY